MKAKRTTTLSLLLVLGAGAAVGLAQSDGEETGASIDMTRSQLEQWVETRRIISQEKRDLEIARETLRDRIAVLEAEVEDVRTRIDETRENLSKTDEQFEELTSENEMFKRASEVLRSAVVKLEGEVKALLSRSPVAIADKVKVLSQQIPDDPEQTEMSLANRYQNVIGVLNEVNTFNGKITVTSEKRELSGGQTAEVTVMYLGISKAYYVDNKARIAGVGTPAGEGGSGWVWTRADGSAVEIDRAIKIYRNTEVADFVDLPLEID